MQHRSHSNANRAETTVMQSLFINTALKLFSGKTTRFVLNAIGGYGVTYGVTVDGASPMTFVGSLFLLVCVVGWSLIAKVKPTTDEREHLANLSHALASMLVPVLIGWMQAKGVSVTGHESMDVLGPMLLQLAASHLNKPDAKPVRQ